MKSPCGRCGTGCCLRSICMPSTEGTVSAVHAGQIARSSMQNSRACLAPRRRRRRSTTHHTFQNLFNNSGPNKGVGLTINIPIRNRQAQSAQVRSMLEYRQAQLQVQQIYLKVRMQVINGQYALTNDRAQVESAQAAADYNRQSLDSEQKKYQLGASTTANVLLAAAQSLECREQSHHRARRLCEGPGRLDGDSRYHAGPLRYQPGRSGHRQRKGDACHSRPGASKAAA